MNVSEADEAWLEGAKMLSRQLHQALPPGSDGRQVLVALAILMSAGIQGAPAKNRDGMKDLCIEILDSNIKFVSRSLS